MDNNSANTQLTPLTSSCIAALMSMLYSSFNILTGYKLRIICSILNNGVKLYCIPATSILPSLYHLINLSICDEFAFFKYSIKGPVVSTVHLYCDSFGKLFVFSIRSKACSTNSPCCRKQAS